jgi:hypothetical protein
MALQMPNSQELPQAQNQPAASLGVPRSLGAGGWARILVLGVLCSVLGAWWEQQAQMIKGTCYIAESVPPLSSIAALLFLFALKPCLDRLGPEFGLSRREILAIYAFTCVSVTVGFINLYRKVIALLTSPLYLDEYDLTVAAIRPHIPDWLVPKDPEVIDNLWQGAAGEGVPWGQWMVPLACIGGIFVLFYFTTSLLIGLFYHRWVADEKLRYPVAELAVELVGTDKEGGFAALARSQGFWAGALIALAFNLCYIIPSLNPDWTVPPPQFDFGWLWPQGIWQGGGPGPWFRLNPVVFGLGLLVPVDVLLTIWLSVLVMKLQAVAAYASGVPFWPLFHINEEQGDGGYIALSLIMLWAARRHVGRALLDFLPGRRLEPFAPGKWTLLGLVGGTALLLHVLTKAGMVLWFAAIFLGLILVRVLVMARIRSQAGIPNIYLHTIGITTFVYMLGGQTLAAAGAPSVAALVFMSFLISCAFLTPYQADGFRLAEFAGLGYRGWVWLSLIAVIVGFVLASVFQLSAMYEYGFVNLREQPSLWQADYIVSSAKLAQPPETTRLVLMGGGAVTTALLALLQRLYHWFPLNPVGFVVATAIGRYISGPMLVVWAVKVGILKLGGGQTYKGLRRAGIGLAFTHLAIATLWALLGAFEFPPTRRYVIGFW